jgi:hypothetical protein
MNQIDSAKRAPIINNRERVFYRIINDIVKRGKNENLFPADMPEDDLTEFITGCIRSLIYDWCLYNGGFDLRTTARERFGFLIELFTAKARMTATEQKNYTWLQRLGQ